MKDKFYNQMRSYAPPGLHVEQEITYWKWMMLLSTCWCLQYLYRYMNSWNALFQVRAGKRTLLKNALMPPFESLTANIFEVFGIVILFCALVVAYHYYYHYQGSKMMYLMRRLPNKWEVHIRCFTIPVVGCAIAILYMITLRMIFYGIYLWCTPLQCLVL